MHHLAHPRFRLFAGLAVGAALFCAGLPSSTRAQSTAGLTQYAIGNPSGDETEILCLINRARANPPAEGQRLAAHATDFYATINRNTIDPALLISQFQSYPARAPLAFNAQLNAAARAHTTDMIVMGHVQHDSSDGTPLGTRVRSFGYEYPDGENCAGGYVLASVVTPWLTHGTYQVDTNITGYGHRMAIMEPNRFGTVEVGISQQGAAGWNTEDFGVAAKPPLVTGVVFTDDAGSGFYASGEGIGGVTVTAPSVSTYYAVTAASGAYTLPLDKLPAYDPATPPPAVQIVFTDAAGKATAKQVTLGHTTGPNGTPYVDATNAPRYDNVEADLVLPTAAAAHPAFFAGEAALSQGVYHLQFPNSNVFGYYSYLSTPGFVYHFDMGYEYVLDAQDGQGGVFLYDFASQGWFYTSRTFAFPYLYDFKLNSTVYYYPDPNNPGRYNTDGVRYLYVFATGQIIAK